MGVESTDDYLPAKQAISDLNIESLFLKNTSIRLVGHENDTIQVEIDYFRNWWRDCCNDDNTNWTLIQTRLGYETILFMALRKVMV